MLSAWDLRYPNCPPLGHVLRRAFPDRWVRFHSLPDSKRDPENDAELAEVLARHNRILGELVRPGERVVLLTGEYDESSKPNRTPRDYHVGGVPWRVCAMLDPNDASIDEPSYFHVFADERVWRPGEFDPLVRLLAEFFWVPHFLVVAPDCRWVLHPYDGGMDIIAEDRAERDRLASRFAGWLSARADGL
jgi:hypothetical protein